MTRSLLTLCLAGGLLSTAACDGGDTPSSAPFVPTAGAVQATLPPVDATSSAGESPLAGRLSPVVRLELAIQDSALGHMTGMYQLPDGRWLATTQPGRVLLVDFQAGTVSVFLDIQSRVRAVDYEEGLLGLALAPDYDQSHHFYVYFTEIGGEKAVLARFTTDPSGDTASLESETLILEANHLTEGHNGGQLTFGPDDYLYLSVGDGGFAFDDGGASVDQFGNGQNLGTLESALLRIDVSEGQPNYAIPSDNPFVGMPDAREEIWAYGFRNPWRFSFDTETGDVWLADVGEHTKEEINRIQKGGNYGWSIMEGSGCVDSDNSCERDDLLLPILEYGRDAGCSITGGFVYRGQAITELRGAYVYGDYCSGRIWALRVDGSEVIANDLITSFPILISSFAQGNDGELYVLDHSLSGIVYRIVP
jgi:glucose/arabinose dehydrogenase